MPDKRDQGLVYDRYVLRWKKRSDDDFLPELILSKTHEDDEELERLDPKRTIWMKNPLTGEDDTPQPPRSIGERLTFSGHMEALLQYFVSDN